MPQKKVQRKLSSRKEKPVRLKSKIEPKTYELDATDKILGRLSTEVASILRGKNKPTFVPYIAMGDKVIIFNAAKIRVTGAKLTQKIYYRHSGYIGHLKSATLQEKMTQNPADVLKRSITGMLPKNKLRKIWMRNLVIYNGDKNGGN